MTTNAKDEPQDELEGMPPPIARVIHNLTGTMRERREELDIEPGDKGKLSEMGITGGFTITVHRITERLDNDGDLEVTVTWKLGS